MELYLIEKRQLKEMNESRLLHISIILTLTLFATGFVLLKPGPLKSNFVFNVRPDSIDVIYVLPEVKEIQEINEKPKLPETEEAKIIEEEDVLPIDEIKIDDIEKEKIDTKKDSMITKRPEIVSFPHQLPELVH